MDQTRSQTTSPSVGTREQKSLPENLSSLNDVELIESVGKLIRLRPYVRPANARVIAIMARRTRNRAVVDIEKHEGQFTYNCFVVEICNTLITECRKCLDLKKN
jgi:hypothetical protein